MASRRPQFSQGVYHVQNTKKYQGSSNGGTSTTCVFRSSWERRLMAWLDHNESVISWGSELISIPYVNKLDGTAHRYYIDFNFKVKDINTGKIKTFWVEVKPADQTVPPKQPKRLTESAKRNYAMKSLTYVQNISKWERAKAEARKHNAIFMILTEQNCQFLNSTKS